MPTTEFMDFKTLADIQGHFDIALDLLLKKENFSHGEWPYKLHQSEASCQYEKLGKQCGKVHCFRPSSNLKYVTPASPLVCRFQGRLEGDSHL